MESYHVTILFPQCIQKPVTYYSVMIAEDDGEIDTDLPELQREDYIAKFGFKYLGIVEVKAIHVQW